MRKLTWLALMVIGCGSDPTGPQLLPGFKPPAPPANGFQVVLPIVKDLQPGKDYEICTWTDRIVDRGLDFKSLQGFQSRYGHHVIMFSTTVQQPPGTTRPCTNADMATFRFGAGAGGEGQGSVNMAPGNLVFRVPVGSQIVVNHHYINGGNAPADAQSAINVYLADPNAQNVPSGAMAVLDTSMQIPAGGGSLDISCTMRKDFKAWLVIPHMHELGTRITVDQIANGQNSRLFELSWDPSYTFNPPAIRRDPTDPFMFRTGDELKIRCEWDNPTGSLVTFGREMCVVFAQTINEDNTPDLSCNKGVWGTF